MPRRKYLAPCAEPGCPNLSWYSYCDECVRAKRAAGYSTARNRETHSGAFRWVYRSKRWRGLRRRQLREHPFCEWPDCSQLATDVDHVLRMEDGGDPWDPANLQSLCHPHHSSKTAREVGWSHRSLEG